MAAPYELTLGAKTHPKQLQRLDGKELTRVVDATDLQLFHLGIAREIAGWPELETVYAGETTRAAVRAVSKAANLREFNSFGVLAHGALGQLTSGCLRCFRCDSGLTSPDFRSLSRCAALESIGAQNGHLSQAAAAEVAAMPNLSHLDLEGAWLTDAAVAELAQSRSLESLYICRTQVTAEGVRNLARMPQLRELDVWALEPRVIDALVELPGLEAITLGQFEDADALTTARVLEVLEALPKLKRVWLDGVRLNEAQRADLEARFTCQLT